MPLSVYQLFIKGISITEAFVFMSIESIFTYRWSFNGPSLDNSYLYIFKFQGLHLMEIYGTFEIFLCMFVTWQEEKV